MIRLKTNYGIHDFSSTIVVYFEKDGIFFHNGYMQCRTQSLLAAIFRRLDLSVEETRGPGKNHRPVTSH
jgi:hypothetical protein